MQFRPDAINVGNFQAFRPFANLYLPVLDRLWQTLLLFDCTHILACPIVYFCDSFLDSPALSGDTESLPD